MWRVLDRLWTVTVWLAFLFMLPIWAVLWYQDLGPLRFFLMLALLFFAGFFRTFL